MDQGMCRLCLRAKPLARSHILPEWGYRDIYDQRYHRGYALSSGSDARLGHVKKGVREPLLCLDCERRFSVYEQYARDLLTEPGRLAIPAPRQHTTNCADYSRFKLFQLSILWRAHLASHRLFATVNVGPHHAERLRRMLCADNPGTPTDYPCVLGAMYLGADHHRDLILGVIRHRRSGHHEYVFTYAGFIWTFVVSSHAAQHRMAGAALQSDGSFVSFAFDLLKSPGFTRFARELVAANRQRMDRIYPS